MVITGIVLMAIAIGIGMVYYRNCQAYHVAKMSDLVDECWWYPGEEFDAFLGKELGD